MKVMSVQVKFKSPYSFRNDEWADVVGVAIVTPDEKEPRICYHLRFSDGACDYTPVSEPHDVRGCSA